MEKFSRGVLLCVVLVSSAVIQAAEPAGANQALDYKTGNPAEWPDELDAVVAAPNNHKILLENDQVRVLEVTVAPGELENLHHHRWPSVLYITEAGDFVDFDQAGEVIFDTRTLDTPLKFPLTMWKGPEAPHAVQNLSQTQRLRLIRVEVKR